MPEFTYGYITMPEELGQLVRDARKDQGLSQAELAVRSGCSQRLVSEFERGKDSVEMGKVLRLLRALGLSLRVMSSRTPEQNHDLVQNAVSRIAHETLDIPAPRKRLADYLETANG